MPASDPFGRPDDSAGRLCRTRTSLCSAGMAWLMIAGCHALTACTPAPLIAYSTDTPPLVLVPASQAGVQDQRAPFREIFCSILDTRASVLPDSRPCEEALTRVGSEPGGAGKPVDLGQSKRRLIGAVVAGLGYECF
ncbi:hypothetical protein V0M98_09955 [Pseudomonas silesiensis]|uniref:hypothetical protein n=1 Tax=Pseudomonas silesiensis TaxID=1853130 RepID=UPI0030CF2F31